MKRTTQAQIGGKVFIIEDAAYEATENYLKRSRKALKHDDDIDDIVADLEAAIADRLAASDYKTEAITLEQMKQVIQDIGEVAPDATHEPESLKQTSGDSDWREKLGRRDMKNKILTGVASGLGRLLNVDPLFVRIAFVVGAFVEPISFVVIASYIVLSFVMYTDDGDSRTAAEMVKEARSAVAEPASGVVGRTGGFVAGVLRLIVGAVRVSIGAVSLLGLGLVSVLFLSLGWWLFFSEGMAASASSLSVFALWAVAAFALIVPLSQGASLLLHGINVTKKPTRAKLAVWLLWIMSVPLAVGLAAYNYNQGRVHDIARENPSNYIRIVSDDAGDRLCVAPSHPVNCSDSNQTQAYYQGACDRQVLVTDGDIYDWSLHLDGYDQVHVEPVQPESDYNTYCEGMQRVVDYYGAENAILTSKLHTEKEVTAVYEAEMQERCDNNLPPDAYVDGGTEASYGTGDLVHCDSLTQIYMVKAPDSLVPLGSTNY